MKILISHTIGNENTRNVVKGLLEAQLLHSFVVSIAVYSGRWYRFFISIKPFILFKRRLLPTALKHYTITYPFKEIGRQLSGKFRLYSLIKSENAFFSSYSECRYIDTKTSRYMQKHSNEIDAVYCYEDIAFKSFYKAKQHSIYTIYDLPIGYWRSLRSLLTKEESNQEWFKTIGGFSDSEAKLANKDKEIELADVIFVASTFTKMSLSLYPGNLPPVYVIPYGFPQVNDSRNYNLSFNDKIKLLYVGGLTQRKGISYMFDAIEGLEEYYELTVVGGGDIDGCEVLKRALSMHNYLPPMAHDKVLKLMSESDILIFPSLFEGFGLVVTEAMSQGTPVITTDRTCGPDIITDGEDGWIVKAADSNSINNLLEKLKNNKDEIIRVGMNARETARKRPWTVYQKEVVEAIIESYKLYGNTTY